MMFNSNKRQMNNKVKIKIVVSHPDEVITTLTDLIQKGEVNVVLFQDYQEKISPDVLEEKLSQSFNLTTGWETEYYSKGQKKDGLKFNRVGDVRIKDQDVEKYCKYLRENGSNDLFYFPNGEDTEICKVVSDYVKDTPRATGIAFANASETLEKDYSPSLQIIMESVIDFSIPHKSIIFDPTFEHWERQGVLMLNSALSCTRGKPGSHSLMWRPFIRNLLTNLSGSTAGIVYLLMGSAAQSFEQYINHTSNHVIRCEHPSYCARTGKPLSSEIWKEINAILVNQNGNGIQWYIEQ